MDYKIARLSDLEEILIMKNKVKERIINENLKIWLNSYPQDELILEDIKNNLGRIIVVDNEIIAYAAFYTAISEYDGLIPDLDNLQSYGRVMVKEGFTKKGIGSFLVESMINEAKRLNRKGMLITVDDFNFKAVNLYKKYGFVKIGEQQFPYAYLSIYKLLF